MGGGRDDYHGDDSGHISGACGDDHDPYDGGSDVDGVMMIMTAMTVLVMMVVM